MVFLVIKRRCQPQLNKGTQNISLFQIEVDQIKPHRKILLSKGFESKKELAKLPTKFLKKYEQLIV